jgi:hypothetical protein
VHVLSWQVCLLGLIMALGIPAIAWIENSALLAVLIAVAVVGVGAVLWWRWHQGRGGLVVALAPGTRQRLIPYPQTRAER